MSNRSLLLAALAVLPASQALAETDVPDPVCGDAFEIWTVPAPRSVEPEQVPLGTAPLVGGRTSDATCRGEVTIELGEVTEDGVRSLLVDELVAEVDETWWRPVNFETQAGKHYELRVTVDTPAGDDNGLVHVVEFEVTDQAQDAPGAPVPTELFAQRVCDVTHVWPNADPPDRAGDVYELLYDGQILTVDPRGTFLSATLPDEAGIVDGDEVCVEVRLRGIDGAVGEPLVACDTVVDDGCPRDEDARGASCACSASASPAGGLLALFLGGLAFLRRRRT